MVKRVRLSTGLLFAFVLNAGTAAEARTWTVHPDESIAAAISHARPGDRIEVMPGVYHEGGPGDLNAVTITSDRIDLIGLSRANHPVVLENAGAQSYGIWVSPLDSTGPAPEANNEKPPCATDGSTIHGFSVRGFTVRGFGEHGLHLACVNGFLIDGNVAENNGVYGIFPVTSRHGALTNNIVRGSVRDAGIYVGQCDDVLIAGNTSMDNLIGIEVENSREVAAIRNQSSNNTIGIFVDVLFDKVKLTQETTLVARNHVHDNNRPNSSNPGDITAIFPPGLGILLVGADTTTVTENDVEHNGFAGIGVTSLCLAFTLQGQTCPPLDVDPNPDHNRIVRNRSTGNGTISTGNPVLDALRGDLVWEGSGVGNCWRDNNFVTSVPAILPICRGMGPTTSSAALSLRPTASR
jgi:parallel beta-helix repeat protein